MDRLNSKTGMDSISMYCTSKNSKCGVRHWRTQV